MHKFILIFLLSTSYLLSNIHAIVSILPQVTFLKAIGGDKVTIELMVQPGNSPHTYEPKPSQMLAITKADLYFAIDVEFENVWLPKFMNLNKKMKVIDIADSVPKIQMKTSHHTHDHHSHEGDDPHIWTDPKNVKIIAQNIYKALVKHDPDNKSYYKTNLETFVNLLNNTDMQIKKIFSSLKEKPTFMVFHPSWSYFAKAYNLEQIVVEVEGKAPKPKELIDLIKEARKTQVKAIFTQAEFSDTSARIIAKELGIPVIKVSPLASNWSENLISIAKTITGQH
ncbi:MAG TPA: zinc ABC transporter substrate-binding protein [Sulfurovum sp.]|nr:zinc ABC transporter substrate-binding protein [Sulfurovum sp.]